VGLPSYTVWFRGRPACPCLAEWLPVFEAELIRRGVVKQSIDITQLIGGADASAGTHSKGGAWDIWQHDPVTVWVARQMGADATWARTTGSFASIKHTHGVLTACPHNGPARYQIDEVRAGGDGLVGSTPDPGPRPLSGRTWREGLEWAKRQQEPEMDLNDKIRPSDPESPTVGQVLNRMDRFMRNEVARDEEAQAQRIRISQRLAQKLKVSETTILAAIEEAESK
jgi:hypothetical protein